MEIRNFSAGDIVKHFKYERLSETEKKQGMCQYEIICEGENTKTGEIFVVYKSLYDGKVFVRPVASFYSEVDKNKYYYIQQQYKFELMDER